MDGNPAAVPSAPGPPVSTVYGRVITGGEVRKAVRDTIVAWADTYVDEMGRQVGLVLKPLRIFGMFGGPTFPPDQIPGCVIVAPGIVGDPERRGDGTVDVRWAVGVGVIVADATAELAIARAEPYGAALRALLVQQGSLGGFAVETTWVDEETTPIAYETDRAVAASSLQFEVQLRAVMDRWAGPTVPPADPTVEQDLTTVVTTNPTLERLRPP